MSEIHGEWEESYKSIAKVYEAIPMAIEYLRENHGYLWIRSIFGTTVNANWMGNELEKEFLDCDDLRESGGVDVGAVRRFWSWVIMVEREPE
ncbi:hypothetical protein ACMD2_14255, partial [Ananas comosus]